MKLEFTNHAKHRLFLERDISVDSVKKAIQGSDSILYFPDGSVKCTKRFGKKDLVAVYRKDKNTFVIITAYFK